MQQNYQAQAPELLSSPNTLRRTPPNVICRFACPIQDKELIQRAEELINNEYALSDTGKTLTSLRLDPGDALKMALDGELIFALDGENEDILLGTIQIHIKEESKKGLPNLQDNNRVAEFNSFCVKSDKKCQVENVNTLQVRVKVQHINDGNIQPRSSKSSSARGKGIGTALIRYAEDYSRSQGCSKMQIAILVPDLPFDQQPSYKQWLYEYYVKLEYVYHSTMDMEFVIDEETNQVVKDELNEMYKSLRLKMKCKVILFGKNL